MNMANLWGPGDFPPDFVTLDDLISLGRRAAFSGDHQAVDALVMHASNRMLVKHALLDIAEQMAAEEDAANEPNSDGALIAEEIKGGRGKHLLIIGGETLQ